MYWSAAAAVAAAVKVLVRQVRSVGRFGYHRAANRDQGWPSGLGSELIIRLRQVRFLHPGLSYDLGDLA